MNTLDILDLYVLPQIDDSGAAVPWLAGTPLPYMKVMCEGLKEEIETLATLILRPYPLHFYLWD